MAIREIVTQTSKTLGPLNDFLEANSPDFFQEAFTITQYVQVEVASEVLDQIRTMLVELLEEALKIVESVDAGQEAVSEVINKLLLLGKLMNALVGVVQGVGEMSLGLGQELSWDFSALQNSTNGLQGFRDGFTQVMDQVPATEDWEALDQQMNRLQGNLSNWINVLQV